MSDNARSEFDDFGGAGEFGGIGGEFGDEASGQEPTALDGIPYSGNAEADSALELNEFQRQAKNALKREQKLQEQAFDTEFWFAVYFQSREQKEAFLVGLEMLADGDKYLDGQALAEKLGIALPAGPKIEATNRITKAWDEFVM